MKRVSSFAAALWLALFVFAAAPRAAAAEPGFSASLSVQSADAKDLVAVTLSYQGDPMAAFLTRIDYDAERFEYVRVQGSAEVRSAYSVTVAQEEAVLSGYTRKKNTPGLTGPEAPFTYYFRVRQDAPPGDAAFTVLAYDALGGDRTPVDGNFRQTLHCVINEPPSSNATLLSLYSEEGELSPAFDPARLTYTMTVPYETQSVTFYAEPAEGATCKVNRKNLGAGGTETVFEITVTAEDGTKQVYTVTVYREPKATPAPKSSDATLISLYSDEGELSPAFDPARLTYTMTVPYETQSVTFYAEPAEGATCKVNRKNLGAGGTETLFEITVTAEDGTKQVYTVTVYRESKVTPTPAPKSSDATLLSLYSDEGELSPEFSPERLTYTMTVPYETQSVTFYAEPAEGATCKVNRKNLGAGGTETVFEITVTAEDGTKQVYTVTVYREPKVTPTSAPKSSDATLISLYSDEGALSPAFDPQRLTYTMTVSYETQSVTFYAEPAEGATCKVNRKNLGAGGTETDFLITVTAEDGTKQIYTVTVYREPKVTPTPAPKSSDATLLSLYSDEGELSPAFDPARFTYTMTVPYETQSVTFYAEPAEGATCKVNRKNLGAGGTETVFEITVTAEDGTKQIYTVTVYREPKITPTPEPKNSDATLISLRSDDGDLTPEFSPERLTYTMTVPYETQSVTFYAEPSEGATCKVNRKNLGAGGTETDFLITVTAEDGTKQVYTVTVYREPKATPAPKSSDATLISLYSDEGELSPVFDPARLTYTMTVPYETQSVTFYAEPAEGATCKVNRKNLGAGGTETDFLITVTAEDGTKQVYTVTVYREPKATPVPESKSSDATLISLYSDEGELSPAFDPQRLTYTMTVPYATTSVSFEAEAAEGAAWRVNRKNLGSGGSSTDFLITVTAEDGTKQVYTVTVHRGEKPAATASPSKGSSSSSGSSSKSSSSGSSGAAAAVAEPAANPTSGPSAAPGGPAGAVEVEVEPGPEEDPGADLGESPASARETPAPADQNEAYSDAPIVLRGGETSLLPVIGVILVLILAAFLSAPIAKLLGKRWEKKNK